MARVRIQGLVRTASQVRQALAGPVSAEHLRQLRSQAAHAIRDVDAILAEHGERIDALAPQSRKAYEFLASLDLGEIEPSESASGRSREASSVRLSGLTKFVEHVLGRLASDDTTQLDAIRRQIRESSQSIERHLADSGVEPKHLTDQSRALRGWVAFFSQRDNLNCYADALTRGKPLFEQASASTPHHKPPILIHFKPMNGLCRVRYYANATLVSLPTPMICFDDKGLELLAQMAFARTHNRQRIMLTSTIS